ncbi:TIGR04255 family protein [Hydrogenophaga intermedia]|uniref:TIGR04255 family protein n=1 Tax=Hydrogenophaga intermedia TaxID=65786 RepID=UPI0020443A50
MKFDRPPVIEVVCGVSFSIPKPIKTAHIGLYWSKVSDDFPRCEDAAPIALVIEGQGVPDSADLNLQVEPVDLPPLRRTWLVSEPGTHLIQLQEDRFLYNWKRDSTEATYPSYPNVIAEFRRQWARYREFLCKEVAEPTLTQLEMTYWNFWEGGPEYLRDLTWQEPKSRFLPAADAINFRSLYSLPDGAGRMHVVASTARHAKSGKKGMRFELTARGAPKDLSQSGIDSWFDLAHEWITQGFADLITDEASQLWGRTA